MKRILAMILRLSGAGLAIGATTLLPASAGPWLVEAAALEGVVEPAWAMLAIYALAGFFGFMLADGPASAIERHRPARVGTRAQAAQSVPRLRRHLTENSTAAGDPLSRVSQPVAPPREPVPVPDLDPFEERYREPDPETAAPWRHDHDHDVEDEWGQPEVAADERANDEAASPQDWEETFESRTPKPPRTAEAAFHDDEREPEGMRAESRAPQAPGTGPKPADVPAPTSISDILDDVREPEFEPGTPDEPSRVAFAADEDRQDWFDGAGDEEEDADDDGAGYGSLMGIGLGAAHSPHQAVAAPRGEAGIARQEEHSGALAVIPEGAGPQDFRMRDALANLKALKTAG